MKNVGKMKPFIILNMHSKKMNHKKTVSPGGSLHKQEENRLFIIKKEFMAISDITLLVCRGVLEYRLP